MTRRRDIGLVEMLLESFQEGPLWLGPAFAASVLLLGLVVLPLSVGDAGAMVTTMARVLSPWMAGSVLVLWGVARYARSVRRRRFDGHSDLASIRRLSWRQFEAYIAEAYRRQGYAVEETGCPGGDGGVDLRLRRDRRLTLVQCKHWRSWKVGVRPVRELLGVVTSERADEGIVVTSGRFTAEAENFALPNRLSLVDGQQLVKLVQSVRTAGAPVTGSDETAKDSPGSPDAPACPRCGSPMVVRKARRGRKPGEPFWGCPGFPRCRGIRPI